MAASLRLVMAGRLSGISMVATPVLSRSFCVVQAAFKRMLTGPRLKRLRLKAPSALLSKDRHVLLPLLRLLPLLLLHHQSGGR